jgi:hypothetical protein
MCRLIAARLLTLVRSVFVPQSQRPPSTGRRNPGVAVLRDFHHNCADTSNLKAFLVSGCLESVVMVPGCRQALM